MDIFVDFNDKGILGYYWDNSQIIIMSPKSPRTDMNDIEYFENFWRLVSPRFESLNDIENYSYFY